MRELFRHHLEDLRLSGLSDATIEALGFYSGTSDEVGKALGFIAGSGLVIPYPVYGDVPRFYRVKPDDPPMLGGKPSKYLSPKGCGPRAYIPPRTWEALKDPKASALITEGEKKAAKADQEGFPCIGLGGVYGFRDREHLLLPELGGMAWEGRVVYLVPDSDLSTNPRVADAIWELGWQLHSRRAEVRVVVLPPGPDGSKQGLDDYLVASEPEELGELVDASPTLFGWACQRVATMPTHQRGKGMGWLAPRLRSLNETDVELVIAEHGRSIGVPRSHLRKLIRNSEPWAPKRPRAEREAALVDKKNRAAERQAHIDASERAANEVEAKALLLLKDPAVVHRAITDVERLGVVGERRIVGLIHLALRSRVLPRPVNIEVNSPSSAGKTYVVVTTLRLEPADAYYELTASSERALIYLGETLSHRTLYIQEPEGLGQGVGNAAIKSLIWEGRLKYDTVVKEDGNFVGQHIEKDGPTGLIVTTTRPLDEQVSNRMLRIEADTSEEQTRRVLSQIAAEAAGAKPSADLTLWHAASRLTGDPVDVVVPFAEWLAQHMATSTLRIRRDFTQLVSLVKASAVEHQNQRPQAAPGLLIATVADYAVVYSLAAEVFKAAQAEGVSDADRKFVNAVDEVSDDGENPASQANLALHLGLSKAAVSYRVQLLLRLGYLVNLEDKKGRPHRLVPGTPLPELVAPLPSPCALSTYLLDSGQQTIVHPWVDPVSGEGHDCSAHPSSPGEQVNTYPVVASASPSGLFIGEVNGGEHANARRAGSVQPFTGVQASYERSTEEEGTPSTDDRSPIKAEPWEMEL